MPIRITRSGMDQAVVFVALGILAIALAAGLLPQPFAVLSAAGNVLLVGLMAGGLGWFVHHLWLRKWLRARRIQRIRMARLTREAWQAEPPPSDKR